MEEEMYEAYQKLQEHEQECKYVRDIEIQRLYQELENSIPISVIENTIKERIEWCIKASNSGLNAIQYACSKKDEIERIERQQNISTMISILKEILQELLDERNNTDEN